MIITRELIKPTSIISLMKAKLITIAIVATLVACNNNKPTTTSITTNNTPVQRPASMGVNVDNQTDCLNFLHSRTFKGRIPNRDYLRSYSYLSGGHTSGGRVTSGQLVGSQVLISFGNDANVAIYDSTGELALCGTLTIGDKDASGGRVLTISIPGVATGMKMVLNSKGQLLDQSDATIYRDKDFAF
jgi:hypothetical protein